MRIFPEGTRDAMEPAGQAMMIIAACMLAIAAGAFLFKTWILYSWPKTTGVVVGSRVATDKSDDGIPTCSAVYSIQYTVSGSSVVTEQGGHSFTSDCSGVRAEVEAARGKTRTVIYNRQAPSVAYTSGGFNVEFYLVAFVLTGLAGAFGFGGWVLIRLCRWMQRRKIDMP